MKLNFLGDGYILFYSFMKQLMFMTLVFGLANLYRTGKHVNKNWCATQGPASTLTCRKDWITVTSIVNYGFTTERAFETINFILTLFSLVVVAYM